MTAAEEVTQVPCGLRRMTFRLTSSQAGAMPDSLPKRARGTYPLSLASFEPAVDDGPDDPAPAGVVGTPGRVDLHGRRRTVDLGPQGVVRPDPEDDRRKPGAVVLRDHLLRVGAGQDALVELGRNQCEP